LSLLKRENVIAEWSDRQILPEKDWVVEIDDHLNSSQVILLLVSVDFIASDYCFGKEMTRAIESHQSGEAKVIPIILRSCQWQTAPFGRLQALPRGAKPVTSWFNRDEAFTSVAQGIRLACKELSVVLVVPEVKQRGPIYPQPATFLIYNLTDVLKYPGVPDITFVEPDNFYALKMALRQAGLGVIVEGPSGIGKTTAPKKAVEQLKLSKQLEDFEILSARKSEDVQRI
jgi:hypothetical protein